MKRDFTIDIYTELLDTMLTAGYKFLTYGEYAQNPYSSSERVLILRHDIDARKKHALVFGKLQAERNIRGTYYFRNTDGSFDPSIMRALADLGHEIGYHYENMDTCSGDVTLAYNDFVKNLERFRKITEVKTACMHGSPLSRHDNREIWKHYDYKALGIIAEPYFDIDFNKVYYVTDTGRRWNGASVSVRDKVATFNPCNNLDFLKLNFRSTEDIIASMAAQQFPSQAMMNFHPQRWTNVSFIWWQELLTQNLKNQIKKLLVHSS